MNASTHFTDTLATLIDQEASLDALERMQVMHNLAQMRDTRVNIMLVAATGAGKSSTINAMFNADKAVVGQGVEPETMHITRYQLANLNIYDTPGLGDGKEADKAHAKLIIDKLHELDEQGKPLIDLVLVILDAGSRDLGTSFEIINKVIIPNLGEDTSRLLVGLNQADMAMKGRHWDHQANRPDATLVDFLTEKVRSTQRRIFEATDVHVEPVYYAAGYKDGADSQRPYNLSKLLLHVIKHIKLEKRAALVQDINRDEQMWQDDDGLKDYTTEIKQSLWESVAHGASQGAEIGGDIGRALAGKTGEMVGRVGGAIVGAVTGFFSSFW